MTHYRGQGRGRGERRGWEVPVAICVVLDHDGHSVTGMTKPLGYVQFSSLDLCTYHKEELFLCGCISPTLGDNLNCSNVISKETRLWSVWRRFGEGV